MPSPMENFRQALELHKEIYDSARWNYEVWIALKCDIPPTVEKKKVPKELRFFLTHSRFANYTCMIINLYKILDTNPKAASLRNLLPWALRLGVIDAAENAAAAKRMHLIEPIWKKIKTLRHHLFAHTDSTANYDDVMKAAAPMASDFEELIDGGLYALDIIWAKDIGRPGFSVLKNPRDQCRRWTRTLVEDLLKPYCKTTSP